MIGGVGRPEPERAVHYLAFANDYADAAGRILLINRADAAQMAYFALVAHGLELAFKVAGRLIAGRSILQRPFRLATMR